MALFFDPSTRLIDSTESILDLPAFHAALRDWEDSPAGVIHPVTHTWKALSLGAGAFMYGLDLINNWSLRFPNPGVYVIQGNLNATIVPVSDVYVERKTAAAYATTSVGASGVTAEQVAQQVRNELQQELRAILQTQTKIDARF